MPFPLQVLAASAFSIKWEHIFTQVSLRLLRLTLSVLHSRSPPAPHAMTKLPPRAADRRQATCHALPWKDAPIISCHKEKNACPLQSQMPQIAPARLRHAGNFPTGGVVAPARTGGSRASRTCKRLGVASAGPQRREANGSPRIFKHVPDLIIFSICASFCSGVSLDFDERGGFACADLHPRQPRLQYRTESSCTSWI